MSLIANNKSIEYVIIYKTDFKIFFVRMEIITWSKKAYEKGRPYGK